jgi:Na+/H+ antiporter NhaB
MILFVNTSKYFRQGEFYRLFTVLIFDPFIKMIKSPYVSAWKLRKEDVVNKGFSENSAEQKNSPDKK